MVIKVFVQCRLDIKCGGRVCVCVVIYTEFQALSSDLQMMWFFTERMLVGKCRAMTLIRSSSNVKTMGKNALSLCTLSHGYYDHVPPSC